MNLTRKVNLTRAEWLRAAQLAREKSRYSARAGIKDCRFSGAKREDIDRLGTLGEEAFSKCTGLPMNRRADRIGGADFTAELAERRWTIAVKTTAPGRRLLERPWRTLETGYDIYVLVYGTVTGPEFQIYGWTVKERLFRPDNFIALVPDGKPLWVLSAYRLFPFAGLGAMEHELEARLSRGLHAHKKPLDFRAHSG